MKNFISMQSGLKKRTRREKHRNQSPEREDVDREWGTQCISSFGVGWAPSDHSVQALGSRNGRLAFRSLVSALKVMTGSRLKRSPESAGSQHGGPTASQQHRKGTGAQTGVRPECEWWQCAQHYLSGFTAVETVSGFFFALSSMPGAVYVH